MNCANCGTQLEQGVTTCPNCGAMNMGFNDYKVPQGEALAVNIGLPEDVEQFIDDEPQITNNEDVVVDVSNVDIIPEITKQQIEEEQIYGEDVDAREKAKEIKPEGIELNIPSVNAATEKSTGNEGVSEVTSESSTVGEINTTDDADLDGMEPRNKIAKTIYHMKRTKNIPVKLSILLIIIFSAIGVFTGKIVFSKNVCVVNNSSINKSNNKMVADGKNNIARVGSYSFKIPTDITYDRRDNALYLISNDGAWRIYILEKDDLYQEITNAQKSIEETLKANGYSVSSVTEKKFSDKEVVIINNTDTIQNRLTAITDAGNDKIFYIEIVTEKNNFDEEVLAKAMDIAANAEFIEEKELSLEKVPLKDASDIISKASREYNEFSIAKEQKDKQNTVTIG